VSGARGAYLIQLLSSSPFDSSAFAAQKEVLRSRAMQEKRNRFLSEWITRLKEKADIEDKRDVSSTGNRRARGRGPRLLLLAAAAAALAASPLRAGDGPFTVLVKGNLTTSSLIYVTPDASDPVARGNTFDLTGTFGYGADVRLQDPGDEPRPGTLHRLHHGARGTGSLNGTTIPTQDGYTAIPVELTGYFIIPLSGEYFGVYMGGGAGVYFGKRTYSLAGVEAVTVQNTPGFAIHVLGGVSYRFWDSFRGILEMKFRDLQFQSVNAFNTRVIRYQDTVINVNTQPFNSRVETDGVIFQLGIAYTF
jgi:hypothetical protein